MCARETSAAISLECKLLRAVVPAAEDTENVLLVKAAAGAEGVSRPAPLALAIALDRSGSMEGEPLDLALAICRRAIDILSSEDILSIVAFDDRAEVLLPARRVVSRERLKRLLRKVSAGRATNLCAGLRAAREQLLLARDERRVLRLLALTDGQATIGTRQLGELEELGRELDNDGVRVVVLALGPEANEQALSALARATSGSFRYVERAEQLDEIFASEIRALVSLAARNVAITVHTPRWTLVKAVLHRPVRVTEDSATFKLPDIEAQTSVATLCTLRLGKRPPGVYRVARVVASYENCLTGERERTEYDVEAEFARGEVAAEEEAEVARELRLAEATAEVERTIHGLRSSRLPATVAVHRLTEARTVLLDAGRVEEADKITRAISALDGLDPADPNKELSETVLRLESGKTQVLRPDSVVGEEPHGREEENPLRNP